MTALQALAQKKQWISGTKPLKEQGKEILASICFRYRRLTTLLRNGSDQPTLAVRDRFVPIREDEFSTTIATTIALEAITRWFQIDPFAGDSGWFASRIASYFV
jgi:hypothetical protein